MRILAIPHRLHRLALFLLLAAAVAVLPHAAAEPEEPAARTAVATPVEETRVRALLTAIQEGDLTAFVEDGDPTFQAAMTEAVFQQVCVAFQAKLKGGYELTYLGSLNQGGNQVHLWKLDPTVAGADDTLVKLTPKDGKVTGFFLQ